MIKILVKFSEYYFNLPVEVKMSCIERISSVFGAEIMYFTEKGNLVAYCNLQLKNFKKISHFVEEIIVKN